MYVSVPTLESACPSLALKLITYVPPFSEPVLTDITLPEKVAVEAPSRVPTTLYVKASPSASVPARSCVNKAPFTIPDPYVTEVTTGAVFETIAASTEKLTVAGVESAEAVTAL